MKQILVLCLLLTTAAARAQPAGEPLMLVAAPALEGLYNRTALLVVPMGAGHMGFIINRATRLNLATLFPGHAPSKQVSDPVHFGGPEMANAVFAVVPQDPGKGAVPLLDGAFLVSDAAAVDRVIERSPDEARFFVGFVGWRPGELKAEIEAGYWYVDDADPALFFREDTGGLWEELVDRLANRLTAKRESQAAGAS